MEAPECDKLAAVAEDSHKLGEFWDWLEEHGMRIVREAYPNEQAILDRLAGKSEGQIEHLLMYAGTGACQCSECRDRPERDVTNKEKLLAKYFGIDLQKVEEERRAILDEIRRK